MKIKSTLALIAATALLLAACGDSSSGGGGDADPALVAALSAELSTNDDGSSPPFSTDDADCAAERIINAIGNDRLDELGVTPADVGEIEEIDFTGDEVATIVDEIDKCIDLNQLITDGLVADGDLPEESAQCFADEFDKDVIKDLLVASFSGDESGPGEGFINAMFDVFAECDIQPFG